MLPSGIILPLPPGLSAQTASRDCRRAFLSEGPLIEYRHFNSAIDGPASGGTI